MKDMTAEINEINAKSGSAEKASCYVYSSWETKGFIFPIFISLEGNWAKGEQIKSEIYDLIK